MVRTLSFKVVRSAAAVSLLGALLVLPASDGRADDLISVPGADPGDPGSLSLSLEYDGGPSIHSATALGLISSSCDISRRLSLGADLLLAEGTRRVTVLSPNGSLLLLRTRGGLTARAGYQNVGVRSFGEQPYLSLSQSVPHLDLVSGWTRDSGHDRLMVGLAGNLARRWSGLADWITGSGNFAAAGVRYSLPGNRTIAVAYLRANDRRDGDGLYVAYAMNWQLRGKADAR
jgi:hypothetical protein